MLDLTIDSASDHIVWFFAGFTRVTVTPTNRDYEGEPLLEEDELLLRKLRF